MNMKQLVTIAASIGLAVFSAPPLAAESLMCGTGTLRDVRSS